MNMSALIRLRLVIDDLLTRGSFVEVETVFIAGLDFFWLSGGSRDLLLRYGCFVDVFLAFLNGRFLLLFVALLNFFLVAERIEGSTWVFRRPG